METGLSSDEPVQTPTEMTHMYSFTLTLNPADTDAQRLCENLSRLPGFRLWLASGPGEPSGAVRATTVWSDESSAGAARQVVAAESGLDPVPEPIVGWREPTAGEARYIRSRVPESRLEEVATFWATRGRAVIESWPGCVKAQGYLDRAASELVLIIWWRTPEDGEAFRLSAFHEENFVEPLGPDVVRVSRTHLEPIGSPLW